MSEGNSPEKEEDKLFYAITKGDIDQCKRSIEKMTDLNTVYGIGKTPLTLAIDWEQKEIVKLLIDKGANLDLSGKPGKTVLQHAQKNGNEEIIALIEGAKKDRESARENKGNYKNPDKDSVRASSSNVVDPVDLQTTPSMNSANVTPEQQNPSENPELAEALCKAINNQKLDDIDALLNSGASKNAKNADGVPAIILAVETQNDEVLKKILNKDNVNDVDYNDNTALMIAVKNQDSAMITALMRVGADVSKKNDAQETALSIANSIAQDPKNPNGNATLECLEKHIKTNEFMKTHVPYVNHSSQEGYKAPSTPTPKGSKSRGNSR